jgi:O-antigen ligase
MAQPWSKAGLSIGCGLLVLSALWQRRRIGTFATPIGKATGIFLVAMLISALISENLRQGFNGFFRYWPLAFLFIGAAAVRDARNPRLYLWTFVGSTVLASGQGILHIIQSFLELGFFDGTTEITTNIWLYSLALSGGVICTLVLTQARSLPVKCLLSLAALSQFLAVFAARRRITLIILGLILCCMIPYFVRRRSYAFGAMAILVALAIGLFSSDLRIKRLHSLEDFFAGEVTRISLWEIGWETYKQDPILGTGLGDFRDHLHSIAEADTAGIYEGANLRHSHCHNNFLQVMATSGTVGLLAFLFWIFALPVWIARHRHLNREAAFLALASWSMLFFAGFTDAPLFSSSRMCTFSLLFGYGWGMMLRSQSPDGSESHAALA